MTAQTNLQTARTYLKAIETGDAEAIASCYAQDAEQTEWPNRLNPEGQQRGVAQLLADLERGKAMLSNQRYEVTAAVAEADTVILECVWIGTLGVAVGERVAGDTMTAHCALAFTFRDGKIISQRNYDCFDSF